VQHEPFQLAFGNLRRSQRARPFAPALALERTGGALLERVLPLAPVAAPPVLAPADVSLAAPPAPPPAHSVGGNFHFHVGPCDRSSLADQVPFVWRNLVVFAFRAARACSSLISNPGRRSSSGRSKKLQPALFRRAPAYAQKLAALSRKVDAPDSPFPQLALKIVAAARELDGRRYRAAARGYQSPLSFSTKPPCRTTSFRFMRLTMRIAPARTASARRNTAAMTIVRSSNPDLMKSAVGTGVDHFFAFINIKDLGLVPLERLGWAGGPERRIGAPTARRRGGLSNGCGGRVAPTQFWRIVGNDIERCRSLQSRACFSQSSLSLCK
jgi:hypothetical protein